jgi:hypothetical protein
VIDRRQQTAVVRDRLDTVDAEQYFTATTAAAGAIVRCVDRGDDPAPDQVVRSIGVHVLTRVQETDKGQYFANERWFRLTRHDLGAKAKTNVVVGRSSIVIVIIIVVGQDQIVDTAETHERIVPYSRCTPQRRALFGLVRTAD